MVAPRGPSGDGKSGGDGEPDDIRESLEDAPAERVAEELAELNLLKYCKDALAKRQG